MKATYTRIQPRLYIRVRGASQSWAYRFTAFGKTTEKLFGSVTGAGKARLSKADAIMKARIWDGMVANGENPFGLTRKQMTFEQLVEELIDIKTKGPKAWAVDENGRHGTADDYRRICRENPRLAGMRFNHPDMEREVEVVIGESWGKAKGDDLRIRIAKVFKRAIARKLWKGANPADAELMTELLGDGYDNRAKEDGGDVKHHESLPHAEVPAAMVALVAKGEEDSRAIENAAATRFMILTTARTSNVRFAKKAHIDRQARTWTVQGEGHTGERMKAGVEHVFQLNDEAMAIVNERWDRDGELLFQGTDGAQIGKTALRDMIGTKKTKGIGLVGRATPHGFRRSFGNWVVAHHPQYKAFADAMLAHAEGKRDSKVTKAYFTDRAELVERFLSDAWGAHCAGRAFKPSLVVVNQAEPEKAAA